MDELRVTYKRDLDHNYMVIECGCSTGGGYGLRMLSENSISGFLPLKTRSMNGETILCYEITSMQPMTDLFGKSGMDGSGIRVFMEKMAQALLQARRYLLSPRDLLLYPEYIYMNPEKGEPYFCCIPGRDLPDDTETMELAEFILKHLDHADPEAVSLGYGFYSSLMKNEKTLARILEEMLFGKTSQAEEKKSEERAIDFHRETGREDTAFFLSDASGEDDSLPSASDRSRRSPYSMVEEDKVLRRQDNGTKQKVRKRKNREIGVNRKNRENREDEFAPGSSTRKCMSGDGRTGNKDMGKGKRIRMAAIMAAVMAAAVVPVIVFLKPDLTQIGGIVFLCAATGFLILNLTDQKQSVRENLWAGVYDPDTESDEEYLDELLDAEYDNPIYDEPQMGDMERLSRDFYCEDMKRPLPGCQMAKENHMERMEKEEAQSIGETRYLISDGKEPEMTLRRETGKGPEVLFLKGEHQVIGKLKDQADILLSGFSQISRLHASLDHEDEGWTITDLNSRNGTYKNGERLEPREKRSLQTGDLVGFADLCYRVV